MKNFHLNGKFEKINKLGSLTETNKKSSRKRKKETKMKPFSILNVTVLCVFGSKIIFCFTERFWL